MYRDNKVLLLQKNFFFLKFTYATLHIKDQDDIEAGKELRKQSQGVPIVAQWLRNPLRNHEVAGSNPGHAQWVKDPALP